MLIELIDVCYTYLPGTVLSQEALKNINLRIEAGESISLVGPTGSGKSTLAQLLCGLMPPTEGKIVINGREAGGGFLGRIAGDEISLVFQFPEAQLFEETVADDIAFGPRNLGLENDEIDLRVREAMSQVGLDYNGFAQRSPFGLSGGEKRLVAIAGVLAMKPRLLILDEPTSGLDAAGKEHIRTIVAKQNQAGTAIVLIAHDMDEVAETTDRVIALSGGRVLVDDRTVEVFSDAAIIDLAEKIGVGVPTAVEVLLKVRERGLDVELGPVRICDVVRYLQSKINNGRLR